MKFQARPAVRTGIKVKIALIGGAGSGKTFSALKVARGIVGPQGRILLFDAENGRSLSYADSNQFEIIDLVAPYTPELYMDAIAHAVAEEYDCVILDSISPEWDGVGGILQQKEMLDRRGQGQNQGARGGNGFTNWAVLTPKHQAFVDAIVQAPIHLIATVRAKQEYAMGSTSGKNTVEKLGVKPIQRDNIEYEFHTVLLLDQTHQPILPPVKDTTGIFENHTGVVGLREGEAIGAWANSGEPYVPPAPVAAPPAPEIRRPAPKDKEVANAVVPTPDSDLVAALNAVKRSAYEEFTRLGLGVDTDGKRDMVKVITQAKTIMEWVFPKKAADTKSPDWWARAVSDAESWAINRESNLAATSPQTTISGDDIEGLIDPFAE